MPTSWYGYNIVNIYRCLMSRRSDCILNMPALMLGMGEPSLSYILVVRSFSSVISRAYCIASTSFIVLQSPERRDGVGGGELGWAWASSHWQDIIMCTCVHVDLYVAMYVYTYMYVCSYTYMYVATYVCRYVCMQICMYVAIYICIYVCSYVFSYVCIYVCM